MSRVVCVVQNPRCHIQLHSTLERGVTPKVLQGNCEMEYYVKHFVGASYIETFGDVLIE